MTPACRIPATAIIMAILLVPGCTGDTVTPDNLPVASRGAIQVTSPDFVTGATVPRSSTCEGENRPPTLQWTGGPAPQQFAVTMVDRDAPGGRFVHWVAWGIPSDAPGIAAGSFPAGVKEGRNDGGSSGYTGPCPPKGDPPHRYTFTVYALSTPPTLQPGASLDDFLQGVNGSVEATGVLVGTFAR